MNVVAPHLVRRLPFLFPLYEDGPYRPWFVQSGILLYSTMARARAERPRDGRARAPHGAAVARRAAALVRVLCGRVDERRPPDARERAAAAAAGATVLNYAEVVALRGPRGRRRLVDGRDVSVRARSIVNATGPWVDRVRRLEDPAAKRVDAAQQGRARARRRRRGLGRGADDLARQGARQLRGAVGRDAAARHDRHAARRRARGRARHRRGRRRCWPRRRWRSTGSAPRARRSAACAFCRAATGRRRTHAARRCTRPGRRGW